MELGDHVITSQAWADAFFNGNRVSGVVRNVLPVGRTPQKPERTHVVEFSGTAGRPFGDITSLVFDPADLELVNPTNVRTLVIPPNTWTELGNGLELFHGNRVPITVQTREVV